MWLPTSLAAARVLGHKRSRVCVSVVKERPRCRAVILRGGLQPRLVDGVWDGRWAKNADHERIWLSEGMRKQMRRMIAEGVWTR